MNKVLRILLGTVFYAPLPNGGYYYIITPGNTTISVEAEMSLGKGKHQFKEKKGHM